MTTLETETHTLDLEKGLEEAGKFFRYANRGGLFDVGEDRLYDTEDLSATARFDVPRPEATESPILSSIGETRFDSARDSRLHRYALISLLIRMASTNILQGTLPLNVSPLVEFMWKEQRGHKVTVSESLRCSHEQVLSSALIPPSGAYLTWLELMDEESE